MKPQNMIDSRVKLVKKLEELETKMQIPLPSKEIINQVNTLSKEIREKISQMKREGQQISIEERRYLRIITSMNQNWPLT